MAYLLYIETATSNCSVTISENNKPLYTLEKNEGFTHAENLHLFIKEVIKKAGIEINALNAVVVSEGPGSYTGLRIGHSTAKGICFALNIPLIAVNTLLVMANEALSKITKENVLLCPMLDARRMEVYTAIYDAELKAIVLPNAKIISADTISEFHKNKIIYFFGDGMPKCKELLETNTLAKFIEGIVPSSTHMVNLGYAKFENKQFEDVAYFEPNYLKEFYTKAQQ